jgi:hypothetical protein
MHSFLSIIIVISSALAANAILSFAGVDIGVYLSYLLWMVSLGIFMIMLPSSLPTG